MKLTIAEYSTSKNISISAVYKQISQGKLAPIVEGGRKYIEVEETAEKVETDSNTLLEKVEELANRNADLTAAAEKAHAEAEQLRAENGRLLERIAELSQLNGFLQGELQQRSAQLTTEQQNLRQLTLQLPPARKEGIFSRLFGGKSRGEQTAPTPENAGK